MADTDTAKSARAELAEATAAAGWTRHVDERVDVYLRGDSRVRVIWRGDDDISGGSRFHEDIMETYSNDPDTVKRWLTR